MAETEEAVPTEAAPAPEAKPSTKPSTTAGGDHGHHHPSAVPGAEAPSSKTVDYIMNGLLVATAGWGMQVIMDRPYAGTAFGVYLLKGLTGIISDATENSTAKSVRDVVSTLARHTGIPLIATEMTSGHCVFLLPTVSEYFIIPAADFIGSYIDKPLGHRLMSVSDAHALGATHACMVTKRGSGYGELLFVHAFLGALISEGLVASEYTTGLLALACGLTWAAITGALNF